MNKKQKTKKLDAWFFLGIGTIGIFIIFICYVVAVNQLYPNLLKDGNLQDMFAGISAIFSALAFLGLIVTILLQRQELGLQRKELELTRAELKRTATAQERSEEALNRQAASLKATAKLNGLSSLLQHQNTLIGLANTARYGIDETKLSKARSEADKIIIQIENLIAGK